MTIYLLPDGKQLWRFDHIPEGKEAGASTWGKPTPHPKAAGAPGLPIRWILAMDRCMFRSETRRRISRTGIGLAAISIAIPSSCLT